LSSAVEGHDQSVPSNARILDGFIEALDLQDITLLVHDVGGPIGFLVASSRPERFRGMVLTNTFGWPLADYPTVRRILRIIGNPVVGVINEATNVIARFTATSYGVGRLMSKEDRRAFLGPWRDHANRRATQQVLAHVADIDPLMREIETALQSKLNPLPVLTLFGRKNDRYGWQARFNRLFGNVTAAVIDDGHHFPFNDDPQFFSRSITEWWKTRVGAVR
jgi:pimeloyl-ACP methyl ester carboxylesterase